VLFPLYSTALFGGIFERRGKKKKKEQVWHLVNQCTGGESNHGSPLHHRASQ
jgi:hypothetical protein